MYIPYNEADVDRLKSELTVVPKYSEDGEPVKLYDEKTSWFGVPIHHYRSLQSLANEVEDLRVDAPAQFKFKSKYWDGQEAIVDSFKTHVGHGVTGFILEAPPGAGKTVMVIAMLAHLGQRTLVVVPRSNLIRQWEERLKQHSTLQDCDIGWVEGGKGDWRGKKVVVGLVHSLVLDRYGDDFRKSFGCVVFDEVDRSVPPQTFAPAVALFPAKYRIGVSATIKRQDGMEVVFHKHIGQVLLRGAGENRMKPKILLHYFTETSGYIPSGMRKMNRRGMLISRLSVNKNRNAVIANYARLIWKSGRRTLVLSDRKEQLILLRLMLIELGIPRSEIGFYVRSLTGHNMTEKDRRKVATDCKIILATYGMIALGTDIQDLAGLIFATPQAETEQSKGRIERALEGKKTPVVVDIVDTHYRDALGWAIRRQKHYHSKGLSIKRAQ